MSERLDGGTLISVLGEDGLKARSEMQSDLLQSIFLLSTATSVGLALRETLAGTPVLAALLATLLGVVGWVLARRAYLPLRLLGLAFFGSLVALVVEAALDLGGAAGSALSFSFIPGFLAVLVLGPRFGFPICGLMLACLGWLAATTPLPAPYDRLRFIDEVAMTVFTAALAYSLTRAFADCEREMLRRRAELAALSEQRQTITQAIYDELEPLAARLVEAAPGRDAGPAPRAEYSRVMRQLVTSLSRAKELARRDEPAPRSTEDSERSTRRRAMRVWLRIGSVFMAFIVIRNFGLGAPFVPSIFSLSFCIGFDVWLSRPKSPRALEWTALAIGLLATAPLVADVMVYGVSPDAPPLVVTPSIVLFTALLSRGPATWVVAAVNLGLLAWVGLGRSLSLAESRLLGDLAFSFLVVAVALSYVFGLRRRYALALSEQGNAMTEALRQHRKLAGTLFHDVSNHLQVLSFQLDADDAPELPSAESLSRRVQRLILLSKDFLLSHGTSPDLSPVELNDTLSLLNEAFAPRLDAKRMRLSTGPGMDLRVKAQPELLVESVLGNLLSNAVKFSPQGSAIELFAERAGPDVRIVLRDSGPGLPPELIRRLEHDEALPTRPGTAGETGQGYGLQLVREHLQRMGGSLELRLRSGGGTEAVVRLQSA